MLSFIFVVQVFVLPEMEVVGRVVSFGNAGSLDAAPKNVLVGWGVVWIRSAEDRGDETVDN